MQLFDETYVIINTGAHAQRDGFNSKGGFIEINTGGMFMGKSEELVRRRKA